MRILILLGCLVASSLAQGNNGGDAANEAQEKFGPILCALNELQVPDNINIDLSILIAPLNSIAKLLKTTLDEIAKIAKPQDPTLQKALQSIVDSLKDIITNSESAVSEIAKNPRSLKPIIGRLRAILLDVINLFTSLEKLIVTGLGLVAGGNRDASKFVVKVSDLVSAAIGSILSELARATRPIPIIGDIFKAFNDLLFPIIKQVVSVIDGALSVFIPVSLGLGGLISQVTNIIDNLLSQAIQPIVDSILPSGSSACGSGGKSGSGTNIASNVINMLGSLVSSPASVNIDDLLGSIGKVSPSIKLGPNNQTRVIRPSPDTVCIPLKETRPTLIETLNSSLGSPLINVGVQISSGMSGKNSDLGGLLDLLEPLLRVLRPSIDMLKKVPIGSSGSVLLDPILQILQSLVSTLTENVPTDATEIISRLRRTLVLLIGFTAVAGGGNPVLSNLLKGLLLSVGQAILSLLKRAGQDTDDLLQALTKTLLSLEGNIGNLVPKLPAGNVGSNLGSQSDTGGGGDLLSLLGGLLGGIVG